MGLEEYHALFSTRRRSEADEGLKMFLNRHGFDVKPEMVSSQVALMFQMNALCATWILSFVVTLLSDSLCIVHLKSLSPSPKLLVQSFKLFVCLFLFFFLSRSNPFSYPG